MFGTRPVKCFWPPACTQGSFPSPPVLQTHYFLIYLNYTLFKSFDVLFLPHKRQSRETLLHFYSMCMLFYSNASLLVKNRRVTFSHCTGDKFAFQFVFSLCFTFIVTNAPEKQRTVEISRSYCIRKTSFSVAHEQHRSCSLRATHNAYFLNSF